MSKSDNQHFPKTPFQRGTDKWFDRFFDRTPGDRWQFVVSCIGIALILTWIRTHH